VYLLARASAAVVGTATVWLVYRIGVQLFTRRVGLIAALLLGVAFLHVRDSHYAVNDVPSTFLLMACFCWCVKVYQRGQRRDYVLAGLLGGLAVATKYSTGIIAVSLLTAHALRCRRAGQPLWSNGGNRLLIAAAAASALGFLLGCPYALLDLPEFARGFVGQAWLGSLPEQRPPDSPPSIVLYVEALGRGFGVIPLIFVVLMTVAWVRDPTKRPRACLLLVFPLIYLAFMLTVVLFYVRFTIPMLPFVALAAALAIDGLVGRLSVPQHSRGKVWIATSVLGLIVSQPLLFSIRHNVLISRPDTRELVTDWAVKNLPEDATIAYEAYSPTFTAYAETGGNRPAARWGSNFRHLDAWLKNTGHSSFRTVYLLRVDPLYRRHITVSELQEMKVDFAVINSFGYARPDRPEIGRRMYRSLTSGARLIQRVSPMNDGSAPPYREEHLYSPFLDLFSLERPGPEVKVYEIPRAAS
jgi:4-amino-4-deoxy-L-arabinose transferase-like glycosyltransferase